MPRTAHRVLVTHWIHPEVLDRLEREFVVIPNPTRDTWPREKVVALASDCDGLMAFMPDRVDDAFLARCPRLRIVAAALKGSDNFDVDACTRRGVWFTRVPDLLTIPTADLAMGLMIGITRRILEGDDHVRSGTFNGWRPLLYGTGLVGRTLGIVGLGAVGRAVAQRALAFGMKVIYEDPAVTRPPAEVRTTPVSRDRLLAESDVVMPLVHLNAETHHMIGSPALQAMRRGAFLVNVGRGSVVDEAAVATALASGHLAGYAADVFEMEDWALETRPRVIHPALLADRARTLFTPHLGSAVDDVRRDIAMEAAESLVEALEGRRPRGAMNEPRALRSAPLVG